jgi:hypothetical protein
MFNETEIAISINIRSFLKKIITFITFIETIEIIENASNISDIDIADINDINIIFENIENAPFKNIIVEPASVRRSIRHRKAIFKAIRANIVAANIMGIAEASIISADERESVTGMVHRSAYLCIFLHRYDGAAFVLRHQPD